MTTYLAIVTGGSLITLVGAAVAIGKSNDQALRSPVGKLAYLVLVLSMVMLFPGVLMLAIAR